MEFNLKQSWRDHHESEQQQQQQQYPCAKIAKLVDFDSHHNQEHQHSSSVSALPLFVPEPTNKLSSLSAFPDSATPAAAFHRMESCFSIAQRQELELQALIFKYMLAGAAVPPELLQPIKKSLLHAHPYFLHHSLQHYQPALFQSGYWGRGAMDPEPGRCRRTDGKKWRCSRDVVVGKKYCERHVHRGKNRSRKPVEIPTPTTASAGVGGSLKLDASVASCNFDLSGGSPSFELIKLNNSYAESKDGEKGLFESKNELDKKSSDHMLRPFFDDWPQPLQESNNAGRGDYDTATCLSISMPVNSSSDVSFETSYW